MSLHLDHLSIIVVEPRVAGNVGSIARACQNLGIKNIILINPCDYMVEDAFRLAKNAKRTLKNIEVRPTLDACLDDHHLLVGTTRRGRYKQVPFLTPSDLVDHISPVTHQYRVGIVFGRENHGLNNDELLLCNVQSAIPASKENTVFNLSQAVLIYGYECFLASDTEKDPYKGDLATQKEVSILYDHLEDMVKSLPITTRKGDEHFTNLFKRVLGRSMLEKRDIRLFHKLFQAIVSK
jgi:tRNA/rRNA methyltransferase